MGETMGIKVHAQSVVLHIIGSTDIPPVEDIHLVRHGEIHFLLKVLVFYMDKLVIVVDIARIVVGVLGIETNGPTVKQFVLPSGLHKGVAIP